MWEPLWPVLSTHYGSKATQGSKENHSSKMKSEFLQDVSGDLSVLLFLCTHFPKNLQPERTHLKCYTSCKNVQYNDFPFQYIISLSDSNRLCIFCFPIKVSTELIITFRVSLAFFSLIKYILKDFLMSRSENIITHGVIVKVVQLSLKLQAVLGMANVMFTYIDSVCSSNQTYYFDCVRTLWAHLYSHLFWDKFISCHENSGHFLCELLDFIAANWDNCIHERFFSSLSF